MFDRTGWYHKLAEAIDRETDDHATLEVAEKRLLFRVELGLFLLEVLELGDEPIDGLWAVLSGLTFPRLAHITTEQRRSIAIARILLPFSSRSSWEQALRQYTQLPNAVKIYAVSNEIPFEEQILDACRQAGRPERARQEVYWRTLITIPQPGRANRNYAHPGAAEIMVYTDKGRFPVTVNLPQSLIEDLPPTPLRTAKGDRAPLHISYEALQRTAAEMDKRLHARGSLPAWENRLKQTIYYHTLDNEIICADANTHPIKLDGTGHIVGMVGAGKSTLMKLIAAYVSLFQPGRTIVLVVGDTMTVLDIVDELNGILAQSDERPVALPLIGRTTRHDHLRRLWSRERAEEHGALRWLNTACPLMGLLSPAQISIIEGTYLPGREPCEQIGQSGKESSDSNSKIRPHLCPLFSMCPSQQIWHDLPSASIYVTTPGAMAKSGVPTQVDRRRLRYGEFLYAEADFVIFDEADTVMQWFDNEYATVVDLWGRDSAIFTRADPLASQSLTLGVSSLEERWVRAERLATTGIVDILRQLSAGRDTAVLRRWVRERYFTASYLFYRLTLALLGLAPESNLDDEPEHIRTAQKALLQDFDIVSDRDPLRNPRPRREKFGDEVAFARATLRYRLLEMMRQASVDGAAAIIQECREWIIEHIPEIDTHLQHLNAHLKATNVPSESLDTLALKLAFALNVALLDRNLRIVFYEWYNQPDAVNEVLGVQPYRPSSITLSDVLPIPPTGRIFGTYYVPFAGNTDAAGILSRFEYANIGRSFLLHYHDLLALLNLPGPHTLALSGTSWLPPSTQWHVDIPIQGVLQAPKVERERVRKDSQFAFRPQYDHEGQPIRISRVEDKPEAVIALAQAMRRSGELEHELRVLADLAQQHPELWAGRERLLLLTNSYPQAKAFAKTLGNFWRNPTEIFYLAAAQGEAEEGEMETVSSLPRADVETFAWTKGRLLIAPMGAIGRGYNILTVERDKAAFGAVYFLARPMPHPYDIQALAGELNAYTLAMCAKPDASLWENPGLYAQARAFRDAARSYWAKAEMRGGYHSLNRDERRNLAATTFGKMVQAAGRLVRGGVPFHAFFVDAAWGPNSAAASQDTPPNATLDNAKDSLLTQMILLLEEYIDESPIGRSLYEPFEGLLDIANFYPNREENH